MTGWQPLYLVSPPGRYGFPWPFLAMTGQRDDSPRDHNATTGPRDAPTETSRQAACLGAVRLGFVTPVPDRSGVQSSILKQFRASKPQGWEEQPIGARDSWGRVATVEDRVPIGGKCKSPRPVFWLADRGLLQAVGRWSSK